MAGAEVVAEMVVEDAVDVAKGTDDRMGVGMKRKFVCMDMVSENTTFAAAIPRLGAIAVRSGDFQCREFS